MIIMAVINNIFFRQSVYMYISAPQYKTQPLSIGSKKKKLFRLHCFSFPSQWQNPIHPTPPPPPPPSLHSMSDPSPPPPLPVIGEEATTYWNAWLSLASSILSIFGSYTALQVLEQGRITAHGWMKLPWIATSGIVLGSVSCWVS